MQEPATEETLKLLVKDIKSYMTNTLFQEFNINNYGFFNLLIENK